MDGMGFSCVLELGNLEWGSMCCASVRASSAPKPSGSSKQSGPGEGIGYRRDDEAGLEQR